MKYLLGVTDGTVDQLIRHTLLRDRAVKCFIDPPDFEDAFTVDAMPVLRQADGTLLIPSRRSQIWSTADPEYLIELVADRQREWEHFRAMVRVLKRWRLSVPAKVKSLVMEVLALQSMPRSGTRPEALRTFFTAAAIQINWGVYDPAGHCGPIQPDLDISVLREELETARDAATRACALDAEGDSDEAQRAWQDVFGPDFPAPKKKVSPAITGPALITGRPIRDAPRADHHAEPAPTSDDLVAMRATPPATRPGRGPGPVPEPRVARRGSRRLDGSSASVALRSPRALGPCRRDR